MNGVDVCLLKFSADLCAHLVRHAACPAGVHTKLSITDHSHTKDMSGQIMWVMTSSQNILGRKDKVQQWVGWIFRLIYDFQLGYNCKGRAFSDVSWVPLVIWGSWYTTYFIFISIKCVSITYHCQLLRYIFEKGPRYTIAISWATRLSACWCILGQWNHLRLYVKFLALLWIKHDKHQPPAHGYVLLPLPK